jgi:hypothetical protein
VIDLSIAKLEFQIHSVSLTCQIVIIKGNSVHKLSSVDWKRMLPRSKTGLVPFYMDKNINNRISIGLLKLKTLEMNCSDIRSPKEEKLKVKKKMRLMFVEK